jgi:hypothetical protein
VNLRLFNRNQGSIETAKADQERANAELQRVSLVLQQLAAPILQTPVVPRVRLLDKQLSVHISYLLKPVSYLLSQSTWTAR